MYVYIAHYPVEDRSTCKNEPKRFRYDIYCLHSGDLTWDRNCTMFSSILMLILCML